MKSHLRVVDRRTAFLAGLALCSLGFMASAAPAQVVTAPAGMAVVEGGGRHALIRGGVAHRFQQIDASHLGAPRQITGIALRSDAAGSRGPSRAVVSVQLGHADVMMAYASFEDCFAAPGATLVVEPRTLTLPDWSRPVAGPAPFDLALQFDSPFSYDGVRPLVVDIVTLGLDGGAGDVVYVDFDRIAPLAGVGIAIGSGCMVAGSAAPMTHTMQIENQGAAAPNYSMRMQVTLRNAPARAPTILNMDLVDPALTVPGLCGVVRALPARTVALQSTDPAGSIFGAAFTCPYIPHLVGLTFHTQMISLDPTRAGVGVALSEGRVATMPVNTAALGHDTVCHSADAPAAGNSLDFGAGIVLGLFW